METNIRDISVMSPHELYEYQKYLQETAAWHEGNRCGNEIDLHNAMYMLDQIEDVQLSAADHQVEEFMEMQAHARDREYELEQFAMWGSS